MNIWYSCTECVFGSNSKKLANTHEDSHEDHTIIEEKD